MPMAGAGHSVLLVTHNIHHVFAIADRIIVMRRGEIVAELVVTETDFMSVESAITGADIATLTREEWRH